jgi:hypothetical protein
MKQVTAKALPFPRTITLPAGVQVEWYFKQTVSVGHLLPPHKQLP